MMKVSELCDIGCRKAVIQMTAGQEDVARVGFFLGAFFRTSTMVLDSLYNYSNYRVPQLEIKKILLMI